MDTADAVIALAAAAEPRCGDCLVVGVDGPSGSGKTTLADELVQRLGCPVVHMDDLFPGWDGLAAASGLLYEQVLVPLAAGAEAGYRRWDWERSAWGGSVRVPWTPLLVVEGCASTVLPAGGLVAVRIWVEADAEVRMARGIERDGEAFRPHWQRWAAQEAELFGADGTRARADLVVHT